MIWFKSALVGLVAALIAAILPILWTVAWFFWSVARAQGSSGGIGAGSVGFFDGAILLRALLGFALGFWWMWRRQRRQLGPMAM